VWARVTGGNATYRNLVSRAAASSWVTPYSRYNLRLNNSNKLEFWINDGSTTANYLYSNSTIATDSTWRHIVATFDGSTQNLYINGVLDSTRSLSATISASTFPLYFGANSSFSELFAGNLDDIRLYNRALSATEISVLAGGNNSSIIPDIQTLTINGTLTHTNGTFIAPPTTSIAGNFVRSGGTFTPGTGTLTLTGTNQLISGSTTFNNLTKTVSSADTLTFAANSRQDISGTLTLTGAAGQLLSLRSSTPGTLWKIAPTGSFSISYVDVQDSFNRAPQVIYPADSVDSGNNFNWFSASTFPIIRVKQAEAILSNGVGSFNFGSTTLGNSIERTFTIENIGTGSLSLLGSPAVALASSAHFVVSSPPATSVLGAGESTTFTVRYDPTATSAAHSTTVTVTSDDTETPAYTFTVQGTESSSASGAGGITISSQPTSGGAGVGSTRSFSVTASASATLSYQWIRLVGGRWTNIAGATASTYTTPVLALSDSGSQFRVRVTDGTTVVVSNAATLTVSSDPYFANVVLLINGDGSNNSTSIVDSSANPKTLTLGGNTKISTAQNKHGGSSVYYDGSGDYISLPASSELSFGGDYTIEFWYYHNANGEAW
jgi:hypothetical protein